MQQCIKIFIPCLYEAQHVSGDIPPIFRSLKLHWQPLVLHTAIRRYSCVVLCYKLRKIKLCSGLWLKVVKIEHNIWPEGQEMQCILIKKFIIDPFIKIHCIFCPSVHILCSI